MADRNELLNDPEAAMRAALDGRQAGVWTALPGIVVSVDLAAMTCKVQPSIQGTVTLENGQIQSVNLPVLVDVPLVFPSAGGFLITLPIAADDEVLVVFSSRCIDAWWQSGGIGRPMEARMHDLSDGFAIPGPRSQPNVVSGISATGAQIRNDAGTTYIEIAADGKIKLVSPSTVQITAPAVTMSGTLVVTGALTAATVAAGGIGLATHKHSGVTPGAGTSGGPVP